MRPPMPVLALLDDAGAGLAALELSSMLARAMQRDLGVVYVESAPSLVAATFPFTRVLPHAGSPWMPFSTDNVELGFRAHAARLRAMAQQIASRHQIGWSLRVVRGTLVDVAGTLWSESDLLLLAAPPRAEAPRVYAARPAKRRVVVAVIDDGSASGARAADLAARLAPLLGATVETVRVSSGHGLSREPQTLARLARADVTLLPRGAIGADLLVALRRPLLMVG